MYRKPGDEKHSELKYAKIDVSSGTTAVVAAVPDRKIRVIGYFLSVATGTWKFVSGSSTDLTGTISESVQRPESNGGYFETVAGEALNLTTTGDCDGELQYVEVEEVA